MTTSDHDKLVSALKHLPPVEVPSDIASRFHARAESGGHAEPAGTTKSAGEVSETRRASWLWLIAASIVLMIGGGWWLDHRRLAAESEQLRQRLAAAMLDVSPSARLQAVRSVGVHPANDRGVIDALTNALINDASENVRTAAAEALGRIADAKTFTLAASRALEGKSSPFVHAALLRAAEQYDVKERTAFLNTLLAVQDLDPALRSRAEAALKS